MALKYTIRDVQLWASDHGGKCLSKEYLGSHTKLTWMCSKGHTWDSVPFTVKRGSWCPACMGRRKGTIEEMRRIAKFRGGKCLSKVYTSNHIKLLWQCEKGHTWKSIAHVIKAGSWCPYCYRNVKHTLQQMQQVATDRGGKCLSKKYINKETKLKWQCGKGHTWLATPGSVLNQGTWCPVCARKKMGNKGKGFTIEKMHRIAKERKGKCLSKKYINIDALLKWQCARKHVWKAIPYSIIHRGSWCSKCRYLDRSTKHTYHRSPPA